MACVYIVKHKDSENFYIGSTCNFSRRYREHERLSNGGGSKKQKRFYDFIRDNGGFYNFDMKVLCKCNNFNQYEMEQYYISKYKPTLNTDIVIFSI